MLSSRQEICLDVISIYLSDYKEITRITILNGVSHHKVNNVFMNK